MGFAFDTAQLNSLANAFRLKELPNKPGMAVIWTTTPWTLPANQALNAHPDLEYALVETQKQILLLAQDRVKECLEQYGFEGKVLGTCKGKALEGISFWHPLASLDPG